MRMPKQKWSKKAIWIQFLSQTLERNPKNFLSEFKNTLRICVTYRCNLACRYCYVKGLENKISGDMRLEDFSRLVIWAKDKGWLAMRILGGEPTIHPRFTEMLEACYRNRMPVRFSTNNLFSSQIITKLDRFWLPNISINYVLGILNTEQKVLFKENLKGLKAHGIYFHFSCIISHQDVDWTEMFEDAKLYRPIYIRASLSLPGFSQQISTSEMLDNIKSLSGKIFKMQEISMRLGIPFFIYRPLLLCMFPREEWQRLRMTFPFVAFSRCPIGYKGDYGIIVVVNPDLSTFPCTSVFIKGPNIFTFKDRSQISQFYKESLKQLLSRPLMESCRECNAHRKFVASLEEGARPKLSFDEGICQGGCLNFKEEAQRLCHVE